MLRVRARTERPPEEVLAAAAAFLGSGGAGLRLSRRTSGHVSLEGAGGFVTITAAGDEGETAVTAVTGEWEFDVRRFLGSL